MPALMQLSTYSVDLLFAYFKFFLVVLYVNLRIVYAASRPNE